MEGHGIQNLLEVQSLWLYPRLTEAQSLIWDLATGPEWFDCMLNFKTHWQRSTIKRESQYQMSKRTGLYRNTNLRRWAADILGKERTEGRASQHKQHTQSTQECMYTHGCMQLHTQVTPPQIHTFYTRLLLASMEQVLLLFQMQTKS